MSRDNLIEFTRGVCCVAISASGFFLVSRIVYHWQHNDHTMLIFCGILICFNYWWASFVFSSQFREHIEKEVEKAVREDQGEQDPKQEN
jgi:uncharacterized membrane protein